MADIEKKNFTPQSQTFYQRIIYAFLIIMPLFYSLLLFILDFLGSDQDKTSKYRDLIPLIMIFMIIIIICFVLLDYGYFIPRVRKLENPKEMFVYNVVILELGGGSIAIFGIIIGILGWIYSGHPPYILAIPIILLGFFNMCFLYVRYVK